MFGHFFSEIFCENEILLKYITFAESVIPQTMHFLIYSRGPSKCRCRARKRMTRETFCGQKVKMHSIHIQILMQLAFLLQNPHFVFFQSTFSQSKNIHAFWSEERKAFWMEFIKISTQKRYIFSICISGYFSLHFF